jgi:hypothetical protein
MRLPPSVLTSAVSIAEIAGAAQVAGRDIWITAGHTHPGAPADMPGPHHHLYECSRASIAVLNDLKRTHHVEPAEHDRDPTAAALSPAAPGTVNSPSLWSGKVGLSTTREPDTVGMDKSRRWRNATASGIDQAGWACWWTDDRDIASSRHH